MISRSLRSMVGQLMAFAMIMLLLTGSATADVALWEGLVANWTFDDELGTTATDSVGSAHAEWINDGLEGQQTWITGKIGGALKFNPTELYTAGALIGQPASLDLGTNSVTISTWVNLSQLPGDMSENFTGIYDALADNYVLYLDKGAQELRFKVQNDSGGVAKPGIGQTYLPTEGWHHVVATYDGTYAKIYCDGQLRSRETTMPAVGQIPSGQVTGLGYQPASGTSADQGYYHGSMDETAVWNRALNANEVAYLYNSGAGVAVSAANPTIAAPTVVMPTPVVHLALNGNLTNTGSSSGTVTATLVAATDGVSTSTYEAGEIGQGLRLDNYVLPETGVTAKTGGTYVSVPYTMTDEGSVSFWFKVNMTPFAHMSLMDNSVAANDWEMWYNDGNGYGQAAWRLDYQYTNQVGTAEDSIGFDGEFHLYTATWNRSEADPTKVDVFFYVDGEVANGAFPEQIDDRWLNPGNTVFFGGGNDGNQHSVGTYDDIRIYDVELTPEQIAELFISVPPVVDIPGDATGNNIVDEDDAKRLATYWGATTQAEGLTWWEMGDFNNDNVVDARDAAILAANWGFGAGSSESTATAVPEPSMWLLLTGLFAVVLARRQR